MAECAEEKWNKATEGNNDISEYLWEGGDTGSLSYGNKYVHVIISVSKSGEFMVVEWGSIEKNRCSFSHEKWQFKACHINCNAENSWDGVQIKHGSCKSGLCLQ
jgi:hypothetical protein